MKHLQKILALSLCLVCLLTLFSGCHGGVAKDSYRLPDTFDTSRQYELVFWAKNDTNVTQANIYRQAIAEFEALYPNVSITMRLYNNYGDIYNDVITNIATDTTPNICITYPDHIATYMESENTVVNLDALIYDETYGLGGSGLLFDAPTLEEIVPQFLKEGKIGGAQYALPYMRSTEACYVNKSMVEALGYTLPETLTWDFIWEVSEAAMAKGEDGKFLVNGQDVLIPFIYKSTDNMMIQMVQQLGSGYADENGKIDLFNDTTKGLLYEIAEHAYNRSFSTFKISSYPGNFFNVGQCIFAIDSTAGATWIGANAPLQDVPEDQLMDFETVVMAIPQYDTENPQMISQGPSMCLFNKEDPQEVLASWLFMQYLLTNHIQIAYSQTEGYVPVTTKAQETAEYQDYLSRGGEDNELYYHVKIDAAKLLLNNLDNTFTTAVFNGSASLRNAAGHLVESAAKNGRRKKTVDEAFMQNLYAEAVSLYRLDQVSASGRTLAQYDGIPATGVILLSCLGGAWVAMGGYVLFGALKSKKQGKSH